MSTKIYCAYKLDKPSNLWPLVHDIRIEGTKQVKKVLRGLYPKIAGGIDGTTEAFQEKLTTYSSYPEVVREQVTRLSMAQRDLVEGYRKSVSSDYRNPFDFDVSVAFRMHKGSIYVIPYCDMLVKRTLDFLNKDPRLSDFAYWNNVDMPENVTTRDWNHRGEVYRQMDESGAWSDVLVFEVCRYPFFYLIDPYLDILRELMTKKEISLCSEEGSS